MTCTPHQYGEELMIKAREYIKLSREERRRHIALTEPCLEIFEGATNSHHAHRGILAYFLGTTIPVGKDIYACHACNNRRCANPKHMYWGTPHDNLVDYKNTGLYVPFPEKIKRKYGEAGALLLAKKAGLLKRGAKHKNKKLL